MIIVITSPNDLPEEEEIANRLFENGLHALHLRKPGATRERYERFIRGIAPRFRERVVVHDYPELAEAYGLRGIHLRHGEIAKAEEWKDLSVSVSCHSFEEIRRLPFRPAYVFLSPVFDSISKEGYRAAFHPDELRRFLREEDIPVVALGGVTAENADQCREMGFAGVALLGHIWEHPGEAERRFKAIFPDTALSVAGFDPCAGAGITADTKTFEELGVYGLGAASAVTFQNQDEYLGTRWLPAEDISRQVETLARKFSPRFVKIGLIESFETLLHMAKILKREWPRTRIIWDPILKASAGQVFHETASRKTLEEILDFIYLLTPNAEEAKALFGDATDEALQAVCRRQTLLPEHLAHGKLHIMPWIGFVAHQMLQCLQGVRGLNVDDDPKMVIVAAGAESAAAFGNAVIMRLGQGKEAAGQLTGGHHQFIHGGLHLVCGHAIFRFPLGGVFLQRAIVPQLGKQLLKGGAPLFQVGRTHRRAIRMQEEPDLIGQLGQFAFAEGAEAVQGQACLQVIQPAVGLGQREGLLGQFGQGRPRLGVILKLRNVFPAHVDDHQAVHYVLGVAQAAIQGVDTQRYRCQGFAETQAFIAQTSHETRILSFIGSKVLFAGYTGIRRRDPSGEPYLQWRPRRGRCPRKTPG